MAGTRTTRAYLRYSFRFEFVFGRRRRALQESAVVDFNVRFRALEVVFDCVTVVSIVCSMGAPVFVVHTLIHISARKRPICGRPWRAAWRGAIANQRATVVVRIMVVPRQTHCQSLNQRRLLRHPLVRVHLGGRVALVRARSALLGQRLLGGSPEHVVFVGGLQAGYGAWRCQPEGGGVCVA